MKASGSVQNTSSPFCRNAGSTIQKSARMRTANIQHASQYKYFGLRLMKRINSRKNGTAKWNTATITAMTPQPPLNRRTYQGISSGRFSAQMIRNWDSDIYAHNMVNASIKFDRP